MTEDEARTKWCPAFRGSDHGTNRPNEIGGLGFCIGSACMAWRTSEGARETLRNYHDDPEVMGRFVGSDRVFPDGWQYQHTDKDREGRKFDLLHRIAADDAPSSGFCGLAGRPA